MYRGTSGKARDNDVTTTVVGTMVGVDQGQSPDAGEARPPFSGFAAAIHVNTQ
jgi:hypothetical protein